MIRLLLNQCLVLYFSVHTFFCLLWLHAISVTAACSCAHVSQQKALFWTIVCVRWTSYSALGVFCCWINNGWIILSQNAPKQEDPSEAFIRVLKATVESKSKQNRVTETCNNRPLSHFCVRRVEDSNSSVEELLRQPPSMAVPIVMDYLCRIQHIYF